MATARTRLQHARRIVIKVGTRVATGGDNSFSSGVIGSLVRQIAALSGSAAPDPSTARSFIVVSSGAIALGLNRMGIAARPRELNLLQAAAAMGQSSLMQAWERELASVGRGNGADPPHLGRHQEQDALSQHQEHDLHALVIRCRAHRQ